MTGRSSARKRCAWAGSHPLSVAYHGKELKRRGMRFVGPTVCYAFMQAVGMVNDHTVDCHRHAELGGRRRA